MFVINIVLFLAVFHLTLAFLKDYKYLDICGLHNSRKLYVEYGTSGVLLAEYKDQLTDTIKYGDKVSQRKCSVELVTCPSCIIEVKFTYLNISRTCGKSSVFTHCGCDYILIHEHPIENASGEQFCGRFIHNNDSKLSYVSKTRFTTVEFVYTKDYGHAFTLEFSAKRNRIVFDGHPTVGYVNNVSQTIMSPYFPHLYPSDLSAEYVIRCHSKGHCRISLLFTDFLMADSSILEFFDWDGQRMYVISGNIFRPPVILTSGPSLVMRFYANGASDFGFKAMYSFRLGNLDDATFKPNIACGGQVNNLGGGITMMDMVTEGTMFFDCFWIVKPPTNFLHRKTHLYVKVVNFTNFAGTTELTIRQGLTSNEPTVEVLKYPLSHFNSAKEKEHIVPIHQGFYINLQGLFKANSQVSIVYAAFNYKDCFSGLDFLCHNLRCISTLLNCDGFDHCGDNSDESPDCSEDPKGHRDFSKIPNFLFPKIEPYADLTTATFIFLICTFGLIGIIFAMALLLYRVSMRARHQRQIQDHIETIHAILGEGARDMEEEIIIPDEPPDYEPPPEYSDVLKYIRKVAYGSKQKQKSTPSTSKFNQSPPLCTSSLSTSLKSVTSDRNENYLSTTSSSRSCQTSTVKMPTSPPPVYHNIQVNEAETNFLFAETKLVDHESYASSSCSSIIGNHTHSVENRISEIPNDSAENISCFPKKIFMDFGTSLRENLRKYKSTIFVKSSEKRWSMSDENLVKSNVRAANTSLTLSASVTLIREVIDSIPIESRKDSINHLIKVENSYLSFSNNIEPLVINVDQNNSNSETELNL